MKTMKKILIAFIVFAMINGCSQKQSENQSSEIQQTSQSKSSAEAENSPMMLADEEIITEDVEKSLSKNTVSEKSTGSKKDYSQIISSTAATTTNIDENRKIIRTADLQFRVKDVAESTYEIEKIVQKHGGWVSESNLGTEQLLNYKIKVSEDSSLVISKYVVRNTIIIRTPFQELDTTLKSLVPLIEYLDYRIISAKDVTFDLMAEQLKQKRLADYNSRMKRHADTKPSKMDDLTEAERQMLIQQERADYAYIEELKLFDQIAYSTITIDMYETEKYEQLMVPNADEIKAYKPGFGKRFVNGLKFGWIIIQEIVLVVVNLWGVIVIGIGIFILVRYLTRKFSKKNKLK